MQAQTTQIGIVSPVVKGEWRSTVTYNKLNIVTHNGVSFIAYGTVTGIVEPGVTAGWESYWMKLSTSPVPMGEWNSTTTYPYLAIVTRDGSSYIAKEENYNKNPATSSAWQLIAEKGDDGGFSPTAKVPQRDVYCELTQNFDSLAKATQSLLLTEEGRDVEHTWTLALSYESQAEGIHHITELIALVLYPFLHDRLLTLD